MLRLRGYAMADGRFYLHDQPNNGIDTFLLLREVRPILEGTVYRDFDFRLMPDFGNGASPSTILQDAYSTGVVYNRIADFDIWDPKDGAARVFIQPFKMTDIGLLNGLGFGAGGARMERRP